MQKKHKSQPANDPIIIAGISDTYFDSGRPNKILPNSTIRNEGFLPNTGLAAQNFNYIANNHGEWINFLKDGYEDNREKLDEIIYRRDIAQGYFNIDANNISTNGYVSISQGSQPVEQSENITRGTTGSAHWIRPYPDALDPGDTAGYYTIRVATDATSASTDAYTSVILKINVANNTYPGTQIGSAVGYRRSNNVNTPTKCYGEIMYYHDGSFFPKFCLTSGTAANISLGPSFLFADILYLEHHKI
jgi:hypothetical protein